MKLVAKPIILPDDASWQEIEEAKANAEWKTYTTREDMFKHTDLTDKCGSCKFFVPIQRRNSKAYGYCRRKGERDFRVRSTPKCKSYERKDE